mmetsp:Transcript_9699/g.26353  ORF Transcript_9699/g.26353 Transcript_9699/m.26353 type:complete len:270 (+) Transcript_9699:1155-1964(+)
MAPVVFPLPRNPVTTGISGGLEPSISPAKVALIWQSVSSYSTSALVKLSFVTTPISGASYCVLGTPFARRYAEKRRVESRSPNDTSESLARGVRSCIMEMPTNSCVSCKSSDSISSTVASSTFNRSAVSRCSSLISRSACSEPTLFGEACRASAPACSNRFVVFPMAERTTMGTVADPKPQTISATSIMRSAVATDEPPNLTTRLIGGVTLVSLPPQGGESDDGGDAALALTNPTRRRCAACCNGGDWRGRRSPRGARTTEVRSMTTTS